VVFQTVVSEIELNHHLVHVQMVLFLFYIAIHLIQSVIHVVNNVTNVFLIVKLVQNVHIILMKEVQHQLVALLNQPLTQLKFMTYQSVLLLLLIVTANV